MTSPREIIEYLINNPSFFEENQDLFADMETGAAGGAIHFYERQLKVLKDREARHKAKIDMIVDSAESNRRLESELLDLAVRLLGQKHNGADPAEFAIAMIKRQFNVKEARFLMVSEHGSDLPYYHEVHQRVVHGSSICDDRVSSRLLQALFDDEGGTIESCAFVPVVFEEYKLGVMVLGSTTRERFQPGIGVLFLDRLGLLVGGFLRGAE
jgi:uncharacterized protein YigA (DUF484 family)